MAENKNNQSVSRKCAQCGVELQAQASLDLCPKCLLKTALAAHSDANLRTVAASDTPQGGMLRPGEQFGHYRILGSLGGGGMGSVFEADDLETGRRVALKVLSQALDSPEARDRFFREGRLAASINHPNSVYIFGTEEVGGTPVIAMELVPGGTLEDYIKAHGPMSPGEAVDAVLQIIAGLEAAERVGILHRDIKPSNCFRGLDGTVKVGDFGLSISTAIRTEPALTATGAFLGTPAFCSPEQLRGEELTARSDMYAVGTTLFYLLTGRTPFEAKNVVALIATVLEHPTPSPRDFRPSIPEGLAKTVRRCLEKQPGERFKTYGELRQALAPYSSSMPVPARLAVRFVAGMLDLLAINAVVMVVLLLTGFNPVSYMTLAATEPGKAFGMFAAISICSVLYYTICEGCWGATLGKWACRLRVVGSNRGVPGIPRALGRALIYVIVPTMPSWVVYGGTKNFFLVSNLTQTIVAICVYAIFALLFVTARRRNGLAAVHDLVTGTRVISRMAWHARPGLAVPPTPPAGIEQRPMVGPYHVLETLGEAPDGTWLQGYDLRLLRRVWIHVVPAGTPPVPAVMRHLSRIGRQRWLTGVRSTAANWDAFEALDGQPLLTLTRQRHPWAQVRFWLFDLAEEIATAERDGTLPPLKLDRVWITGEGRAKLLDFPAPGLKMDTGESTSAGGPEVTTPPVLENPRPGLAFLNEVAVLALEGNPQTVEQPRRPSQVLLPVEAGKFIKSLPGLIDAAAARLALKPLLDRPPSVTRARRAAVIAGCAAFPLAAFVISIYGFALVQRWSRQNPGLMELSQLLQQRDALRFWGRAAHGPSDENLGIYIATHYASVITNVDSWNKSITLMRIKEESRRFAEKSLVDYPAPTPKQLANAEAAVKPTLANADIFALSKKPGFLATLAYGALAIYVAFPALVAAVLFRGGLILRIAGVAFVCRNGVLASRLRVLWRAIVAWSPLAGGLLLAGALSEWHPVLAAIGPAVLIGVLAVLSVALPDRGLPDRLAGTWPVPR